MTIQRIAIFSSREARTRAETLKVALLQKSSIRNPGAQIEVKTWYEQDRAGDYWDCPYAC